MSVHAPRPPAGHRFATLAEWLRYLEGLHVSEINLGLERMHAITARMGLAQPAYPTISVAGTNGKGSSVALLEAVYREAGYRVGSYTSPHLERYTERVRVGGIEVDEALLCEKFAEIDAARGEIPLTYFEFGTLAALLVFAESDLDLGVFEVGLGGRLDAVNWVDADLSVVTTIGLDHTEWLGDTREAIGREKAGIFRRGHWAVSSDPDTPDSVFEVARAAGSHLAVLGADYGADRREDGWDFWSKITQTVIEALPVPHLPGRFQYRNAAGVLQAVALMHHRIEVHESAIRRALGSVRLAGRFQQLTVADVSFVLDVAHNPQSATALADNLHTLAPARRTFMLIGMLSDKDHRGVVGILAPFAAHWFFVSLPSPRATDPEVLAEECQDLLLEQPVEVCADLREALERLRGLAEPGDRVIVSGSFVTVGEALRELRAVWEAGVS